MAKAVVHTEKVCTLTLSEDEAETLRTILSFVGGSPDTRRRHADAMSGALSSQGFRPAKEDVNVALMESPGHRGVIFRS